MPPRYVICLYIRLSIEEDDVTAYSGKTESGSITTQRVLLHDYIVMHRKFDGCEIIEKCDDGFFGTHFDNRPQFTEMIELVKQGKIDCTIVKDLVGSMWNLEIIWNSYSRSWGLLYFCK